MSYSECSEISDESSLDCCSNDETYDDCGSANVAMSMISSTSLYSKKQEYDSRLAMMDKENGNHHENIYNEDPGASNGHTLRKNQRNSSSHRCQQRKTIPTNNTDNYQHEPAVIALFGAYGTTGHYFMKMALEARYHVRALIVPGIILENIALDEQLTLVTGTLDDEAKVRKVVKNASYVVCLLGDVVLTNAPDLQSAGYDFITKILYPILKESKTCRLLLYQASSLAVGLNGTTPAWSSIQKSITIRKQQREFLQEQDKVVQYIYKETPQNYNFDFIVTRPSTRVWDRPSKKRLAASKSQPGPFPITNVDLAEFSLHALKINKLYNTCPYVVQDGI